MKTPWNGRKLNQKKKTPRKFHTYIYIKSVLFDNFDSQLNRDKIYKHDL